MIQNFGTEIADKKSNSGQFPFEELLIKDKECRELIIRELGTPFPKSILPHKRGGMGGVLPPSFTRL